ncbi:MAG: hypothetical protein PHH98_05350 [Candidatus Gracilibacteria bacterium]|nr:hypothetical protein [Candidatus Gracilibacteria bacterium]
MPLDKQKNTFSKNITSSFRQESVKDRVFDVLNIEPCPNCGRDMINGKCIDSKICGYGHGEDYLADKEEKRLIKSLDMMGNGEKYELTTLTGEKFFFFDFYGRIKKRNAILELEVKGKRYKVEVSYEILIKDEVKNIASISIIGDIKTQEKNKRWKKFYFDYSEMKKYIFSVLSDYRFNKFLGEE